MDGMLPFVTFRLGARELSGFPSSWDSAARRLSKYSLAEVLDAIGRISVVLDRFPVTESLEASVLVLRGLLGPGSTEENSLRRLVRSKPGRVTLFDELQLVTAAKLALLTLPVGDARDNPDWRALGKALLIVNDLVDQAGGAPLGASTAGEKNHEWHQYLIANGFFHFAETELAGFGRARALYFESHEDLSEHHQYLNLPEAFADITGIEPIVLSSFFFALNAHWKTAKLEEIGTWNSLVNRYGYFANYNLGPPEVDPVLALLSAPAEALKADVERLYSVDSMRAYHVLPLAKSPLVGIGDDLYCPSVQLLKRRYTRGLHHLFLSAQDKGWRQQFLNYMGVVFEEYVSRLLRRTYAHTEAVLLLEPDLKEYTDGTVCDGLVRIDDVVVLFEAKAPLFSLAATSGTSWSDFEGKARQVFVGGCTQLSGTIDLIEQGILRAAGVNPDEVSAYVPLIVTLENVPLQALTYAEIDRWVKAEELLKHQKTAPWQAVNIGDLEGWEVLSDSGVPMHETARKKAIEDPAITFSNYLHSTSGGWDGHNPAVAEGFEKLTSEVMAYFAERKRPD